MGFNTKLLFLHDFCSYVDANSMGFKVSAALGVDLLCAGAWALTVSVGVLCFRGSRRRSFVRRRMHFNTMFLFCFALCWYVDANSMGFKFPRLSALIFRAQTHGL